VKGIENRNRKQQVLVLPCHWNIPKEVQVPITKSVSQEKKVEIREYAR
jgi:hypothetical protein